MTMPQPATGQDQAAVRWAELSQAAALFAIDPALGGICLRGRAGPVRDAWLTLLTGLLPADMPSRRVPLGIGDDRLLGGLDLTATLKAGRPIAEKGILAEADGGLLVLAMAERLSSATAGRIAHAMDTGCVATERDGVALRAPARFGVVALDEGQDSDERPPSVLMDRLTLWLNLDGLSHRDVTQTYVDRSEVEAARARLSSVQVNEKAIEALVVVAARLGIQSLRGPMLALRVACAAAALRDADHVDEDDVRVAARLVLAPRATMMPVSEAPEESDAPAPQEDADQPEPEAQAQDQDDPPPPETETPDEIPPEALEDLILAAAAAAIPANLLAQLQAGKAARSRQEKGGKADTKGSSAKRGRPLAARRGELRAGRLGLVDTLRAAAPWQRLRAQQASHATPDPDAFGDAPAGALIQPLRRVIVRPEDFRIVRFKPRNESIAIFVVDASGSSALERLAEIKGAIELLLADCYVRREAVALVAFRGRAADIILPPTRSLARAKRELAGLPGGGGTPLANGLETALTLADSVRRRGQSPLLVLMTDGRANITRDGQAGRTQAFADALQAGKQIRAAGISSLAIDTSPAQRMGGARAAAAPPMIELGQAMAARYLKLPYADAARVSQAVRAAAPAR